MTVTFEAFHEYHRRLWMRYAHTQVGRRAAEAVAEKAFVRLRGSWEQALTQESVPRFAWTLLKEEVDAWLDQRGLEPQLAGTAGFERAVQRLVLDGSCDGFSVLSEEIGLYSAISELPERQQDVVVLRYVLSCTEDETAGLLGIGTATVRSHVRHARGGLARRLGIPLDDLNRKDGD
ncbi:RNA polymerase sigma factor [Streptomyces sp. NPDC051018]|uniref:RNA polymerase sigma factor n=1 Tax=Streptomyces sp. NPDC051018 TaxID=3365639 RepID=UPI0037BAD41C